MRFRLHRTPAWLRRTGNVRSTRPMADCLEELRLIVEHRRDVEAAQV